jgi:hypothetical protein
MSIHIIQDERDFYEKYMNYLRVQTKLKVSIHGVPDEDKTQIKDTLQDLLTAEVINLEHEKSRARGVSDEILDASDLLPTLKELPLPEKERTVLEAKVHRVARQITSRQAGRSPEAGTERAPPALLLDQRSLGPIVQFSHTWQSHTTMADTCICAASGYPGTDNSLSDLIPFPPYPPGRNYLIVSVFLKGLPWSNAIFLRVEPFSSRPGEMEVGLASEVQWHRKIRAWHLCHQGRDRRRSVSIFRFIDLRRRPATRWQCSMQDARALKERLLRLAAWRTRPPSKRSREDVNRSREDPPDP